MVTISECFDPCFLLVVTCAQTNIVRPSGNVALFIFAPRHGYGWTSPKQPAWGDEKKKTEEV